MKLSFVRQLKTFGWRYLALMSIWQSVPAQPQNLVVVKSGNLREGPGIETRIVAKLSPQQTLLNLENNGEWYRVQTEQNQTGWVNAILVEPVSALESTNFTEDNLKTVQQQWSQAVSQTDNTQLTWEKMTTRQTGVLFSGPGFKNKVLNDVPAGIAVHKLDSSGEWLYVQTEDNLFGWVNQEVFKPVSLTQSVPFKNPITLTKNGNLRQNPATSSAKIKLVPAGTTVDLLDSTTDWRQVRTADKTVGWLNIIVFQTTSAAKPTAVIREATVVRNGNVREAPDLNAPVIAKVLTGQTVWISAETDDWKKIALADGRTGWINQILFKNLPEKPTEVTKTEKPVAPAVTRPAPAAPGKETAPDSPPVADTAQRISIFTDELASAEEYHANRDIVKAVDNYFSAEAKLAKSAATAPKDLCIKYRLAKCRYALARSLYTKEDPNLSETLTNVRNAAFSNVSCADEARKMLDIWEDALSLRSQILSIFSLDSVNLNKITKSLSATSGQLPILYEAEAKYLIGRYYLSRLNNPEEAIVWLDESVSLFQAYDRHRSITPDSNLENYFKACLDLGTAYSQISKFGDSSSAFNLAYRIAKRAKNQEWLQYYQKIIRAITDRLD